MGITVTSVPPAGPEAEKPPAHHVGRPPTSFVNPWPSFDPRDRSGLNVLKRRFARDRPRFVPVPGRDELVPIREPDWGGERRGLKATWIGHASFLIETCCAAGAARGVRILCDPVFSERTSPVQFLGPKRYSPPPCALDELPDVDAVVISHDHYDHLDYATVQHLHRTRKDQIHFLCALNVAAWFHGCGIPPAQVTELDWWDGVVLEVGGVGAASLTCTPSQHFSGRGLFNRDGTLWCSWVLAEVAHPPLRTPSPTPHKVYFAGDTGYRSVPEDGMTAEEELKLPHCPAFAEIGRRLGPFDLALLPIGLCSPRKFAAPVHCNPADSIRVHKDLGSKKSIGMHFGTVRGGISQEYEAVTDPPRWWRQAADRERLKWGEEIGLLDIGETLVLE